LLGYLRSLPKAGSTKRSKKLSRTAKVLRESSKENGGMMTIVIENDDGTFSD